MSATSTEVLADDIRILAAAMRQSGVGSMIYRREGEVQISLDLVAFPPSGLLARVASPPDKSDGEDQGQGVLNRETFEAVAVAAGGQVIDFPSGGRAGLAARAAEVQ